MCLKLPEDFIFKFCQSFQSPTPWEKNTLASTKSARRLIFFLHSYIWPVSDGKDNKIQKSQVVESFFIK